MTSPEQTNLSPQEISMNTRTFIALALASASIRPVSRPPPPRPEYFQDRRPAASASREVQK
jgi:hypothetical protein